MTFLSKNETDTAAQAAELAATLKTGDTLFLKGPLGAGKSVFARALIRSLTKTPDLEVPSPTFTLVQTYDADIGPIHHFDLYRLKNPDEIYELGWEEAITEGITIVEWPERLGVLSPARFIEINISPVPAQPDIRNITIRKQE